MTIINIASKKSIYIIPGSKSYTLMPEIYTPVDMDMLDSAGLYSVQRDLDVLIVSDNNTALRQYLLKKTIQGAVSAESIQDLMAATLTNSVYDDEANTILVGGSGGNGGFVYGGELDATPVSTANIAVFDALTNCTIVNNVFTPEGYATACATHIAQAVDAKAQLRFTWPATDENTQLIVGLWTPTSITNMDELSETASAELVAISCVSGILMQTYKMLNNSPSSTSLPNEVATGDSILITLEYGTNILSFVNETQNLGLISCDLGNFPSFAESRSLFIFGNTPVSFDIANTDYPAMQVAYEVQVPENSDGKTYLVTGATENSVINGKVLKAGDFVTFFANGTDCVVSRLVSDGNIRDTISATLNDPTSSVYTQTQSLGGTAGLDSVVSALYAATSDNLSDLTTSLDNFLAYLLANNASLFYEALRIYVQNAVYAYIEYNGDIYNAIAQYVSDSTTGIGHSTIQTAIENSIQNYADGIGVGPNGQGHLTVQEAAQSVISNEIQSGGIIDTAIQAAILP